MLRKQIPYHIECDMEFVIWFFENIVVVYKIYKLRHGKHQPICNTLVRLFQQSQAV